MSTDPLAVKVSDVSKRYRLYHERNQSLKATVLRRRHARYEELVVLDGVSLDIGPGRTVGLIGENGSGKSTLLKCIAGILRQESGTIVVNGSMSALLELGAGFHPELSGRENVYLNASILGLSRREVDRRFDDIVGFAGLERFIDAPVKNYSSGMYVRLGFSVAINVEPDVLLVDEVLAVGDQQFQERCLERFATLRRQGRTVVLVSHSLDTVRNLCDEVAWLDAGRVAAFGTPGDVVDAYVAKVHAREASEDDPAPEGRWGSGEIRFTDVRLLDGSEAEVRSCRTGDPLAISMRFRADRRVVRPVFGVGIFRSDGVMVSGPNTKDAGEIPDAVEGVGEVRLSVDRLLLLPGSFEIAVSCYDESITHAYDFIQRAARLDVEPGVPREHHGAVSLGGTFSVRAGG